LKDELMNNMLFRAVAGAIVGAFASLATLSADAHGYTSATLDIAHPYALPTPPGATTGGAYLKEVDNKGDAPDALVGATSPIADHVELHEMKMDGDVMRMRAVSAISIAPGGSVKMAPGGGYHLMLIGIKQPFVVGRDVPMTLQFEKAGKIDVMLHVQERGADAAGHDMAMHDHAMKQ